ncbi:uncharacterized protein DUF397 [Streptomyces sp. PsTaAH-137]|nr:DUF397 domain-containing protein [Streptomyces sp. SID8367]MYT69767.1 DUF397 domain-containing protein [Streptomyces sp. SID8367]RAJ70399.1 uncharacterized protein DUF397 [Streptomyces sp. PsTaAH-137]
MNSHRESLKRLRWFTARASNGSGACVEVAFVDRKSVAVRDSKDRGIRPFVVGGQGWACFVQSVGAGGFGPVG